MCACTALVLTLVVAQPVGAVVDGILGALRHLLIRAHSNAGRPQCTADDRGRGEAADDGTAGHLAVQLHGGGQDQRRQTAHLQGRRVWKVRIWPSQRDCCASARAFQELPFRIPNEANDTTFREFHALLLDLFIAHLSPPCHGVRVELSCRIRDGLILVHLHVSIGHLMDTQAAPTTCPGPT